VRPEGDGARPNAAGSRRRHDVDPVRTGSRMLVPTLVMGALALALVLVGYARGRGEHVAGLKSTLGMTVEILPLLLFGFLVAAMVQVLVPRELLSKWIGVESGMKGILIGTVAGGMLPGGPYVSLPIVAALVRSGASAGTVVAFLTGWSLWALSSLPLQVGILGWRLTLVRLASTFFFPPIAGIIAQRFFGGSI
jgi:uncharacterized membrane protein YraQ (UPF0718 family)